MRIKSILMKRDGMTSDEADDLIDDARQTMLDYLDENDVEAAYHVCQEFFGLEPDYIDELMY